MIYKILTDSACDLPEEIVKQHNIEVIPIYIFNDEQEYLDKVDISPEKIFNIMRDENVMFRTSQITPADFERVFERYAKNNEPCIYIGFSSGISSTYHSACLAKTIINEKYPDFDIEVYDSKSTCGALGLMVAKAAEMIEAGCNKEELFNMLDHYRDHLEVLFTVDNIDYLYRGGRVSKTAAVVGGLLNIKPILRFNDGKIVVCDKVRGSKKVNSRLLEIIKENADDLKDQRIAFGHSEDLERYEIVKNMVKDELGYAEEYTTYIGSAVSAHTGPGIIAIFYLNKKYNA